MFLFNLLRSNEETLTQIESKILYGHTTEENYQPRS